MIRKTKKETVPLSRKPRGRKRGQMLAVALAGAAVLAGVAYGVYAKYYANTSNKGVTTASNCYFSSNLLKDMTEQETDYTNVYNTDPWNGIGSYITELHVRNFQSQILYNDSNLDLTYNITFELTGSPDGGIYTVTYGEETKSLEYGKTYTIKDITLRGGNAVKSVFNVSFTPPEEHDLNYTSNGVKVTAETTAPDYAVGRKLGGILYASVFTAEYKLENGFDFASTELDSMGGLPYTITYTPGLDNKVHELEIVWDSSLLELDEFIVDKYGKNNLVEDADGKHTTLKVKIEPFASLHLIFYRKDGFKSDTVTSDDELEALVQVTDLDEP